MSIPFTVVIPCYRSESCLKKTVDELFGTIDMHPVLRMHVILVNDCSPDDTFKVIRSLCRDYPGRVTGIDLRRNAGQAQAKMAALSLIGSGITVFMDDDGQHDPSVIPSLIRKIRSGSDLVYAQFPETEETLFRRAGSRAADLLMTIFDRKPRNLRISSFFAISEQALTALKSYRCRWPFIGGWLMMNGYRTCGIPAAHRKRSAGSSGYTLRKLVRRTAEVTILFRIPLRAGDPPPWEIRRVITEDGIPETSPSDPS